MKFNLASFTMTITKTSVDQVTGERRIRLSASDTGADCFGENMSIELFSNFVSRIAKKDVPAQFKSILQEKSGWDGGMPYASISHYKSGVEGKNIPADIIKVYLDGKVLKSVAVVRDNTLGNALWANLLADQSGTSKFKDKIRVSIGFLDLKHSHGDFVFERTSLAKACPMCENSSTEGKVYLDGVLVHEAFTRKPANPRTDVEVIRMADEIKTREDDAESIVGKDGLAEIEINKSAIQDEVVLVVKAEVPMEDEEKEHEADCTCKACASKKKKSAVEPEVVEPVSEVIPQPVTKSELETAFESLVAEIEKNKSLPKAEALQNVQPAFNTLGEVVQKSFADPAPEPIAFQPGISDEQIQVLMSQFRTVMAEAIAPIQSEVAILKSQLTVKPLTSGQVPAPRTVQVERSSAQNPIQTRDASKGLSIRELVEQTTKF